MHELLAVCYLVVDRDSLVVPPITSSPSPLDTQTAKEISDKAMYATLDRKYVEHDAFELFVSLMKPAKAFYEWRAEEGPVSPSPSDPSSVSNVDWDRLVESSRGLARRRSDHQAMQSYPHESDTKDRSAIVGTTGD